MAKESNQIAPTSQDQPMAGTENSPSGTVGQPPMFPFQNPPGGSVPQYSGGFTPQQPFPTPPSLSTPHHPNPGYGQATQQTRGFPPSGFLFGLILSNLAFSSGYNPASMVGQPTSNWHQASQPRRDLKFDGEG